MMDDRDQREKVLFSFEDEATWLSNCSDNSGNWRLAAIWRLICNTSKLQIGTQGHEFSRDPYL